MGLFLDLYVGPQGIQSQISVILYNQFNNIQDSIHPDSLSLVVDANVKK